MSKNKKIWIGIGSIGLMGLPLVAVAAAPKQPTPIRPIQINEAKTPGQSIDETLTKLKEEVNINKGAIKDFEGKEGGLSILERSILYRSAELEVENKAKIGDLETKEREATRDIRKLKSEQKTINKKIIGVDARALWMGNKYDDVITWFNRNRDAIQDLKSKNSEILKQIKDIEENKSSSKDVEKNNEKIAEVTTLNNNNLKKINALTQRLNTFQTKLSFSLKRMKAFLRLGINKNINDIKTLKSKNLEILRRLNTYQDKTNTHADDITALKTKTNKNTENIQTLFLKTLGMIVETKELIDKSKAIIPKEVTTNTKDINTLKKQQTALELLKDGLRKDINKHDNKILGLETDQSSLTTKVKTNIKSIEDIKLESSKILKQIDGLTLEDTRISKETTTLKEKQAALELLKDGLRKDINKYMNTMNKLEDKQQELITKVNLNIGDIKKYKKTLHDDITKRDLTSIRLNKVNQDLKDVIALLKQDIIQLQRRYTMLLLPAKGDKGDTVIGKDGTDGRDGEDGTDGATGQDGGDAKSDKTGIILSSIALTGAGLGGLGYGVKKLKDKKGKKKPKPKKLKPAPTPKKLKPTPKKSIKN